MLLSTGATLVLCVRYHLYQLCSGASLSLVVVRHCRCWSLVLVLIGLVVDHCDSGVDVIVGVGVDDDIDGVVVFVFVFLPRAQNTKVGTC